VKWSIIYSMNHNINQRNGVINGVANVMACLSASIMWREAMYLSAQWKTAEGWCSSTHGRFGGIESWSNGWKLCNEMASRRSRRKWRWKRKLKTVASAAKRRNMKAAIETEMRHQHGGMAWRPAVSAVGSMYQQRNGKYLAIMYVMALMYQYQRIKHQ